MEEKKEKALMPEEKKQASSKLNIHSPSAEPEASPVEGFSKEDFSMEDSSMKNNSEEDLSMEDFSANDFSMEGLSMEGLSMEERTASEERAVPEEGETFFEEDFGTEDLYPSESYPSEEEAPLSEENSFSREASFFGESPYSGEESYSGESPYSGEELFSGEQPVSEERVFSEEQLSASEEAGTGERELENTLDSVRKAPSTRTWKTKKEEKIAYREKIRRHQRRVYRRTLLSVIITMALLVAAVLFWMSRGYTRAELKRVCTLSTAETDYYENLGGNLVRYGAGGAVCIDRLGNTLWNVSYEMYQPVTSVGKNVIAIANQGGNTVYVMNSRGLMGTIRTMLPIHSVAVAENGNVAVIMNDKKKTWVRLYSAKGTEIAYVVSTMEENGYPIAAAVSPDGKTLCLSSVQLSNTTIKTNVSFYNFGKKGEKAADYKVDHSDRIDEVIPQLCYLDNSTCVGVSDKYLIYFKTGSFGSFGKGDHLILVSKDLAPKDGLQGFFYSENFAGLLNYSASLKNKYRLDLYDRRGKKAGGIEFSMRYSNIEIAGDKIYIYNEHQCKIFSLNGRCLFDGSFEKKILSLIPGAGLTDLLAVTEGEVDAVQLR